MAVSASHAALPYPIKGARYSMLVPFLDADGDPTAQTTPDTEVSKDNGSAADAAEEVSATSGMDGMGLITFTGAETDCSSLGVNFKCASGPKATLATIYPRALASIGTGTLSAGSAGGGTLGTLLAYDVTGCFIRTTGGTGGGSTGGANNQARKIATYNTSSGAFTVVPNWETTPSTDTTYEVHLPEGVTLGMLRALNPATPGRTLVVDSSGLADANMVKAGPTGSGTAQTAKDIGAINVTALNTLSGHDPGATLGTSTLTQTQVTGGAYALNSSSFAFNSGLDFTTTQKAATLARVTLTDTATTLTNLPAIPNNWLTAAGTAADYVTEVQSGLATAAALSTAQSAINAIDDLLDTEIGAIISSLATIDGIVDDIVAVTDQMVFSVTNALDVNVTHYNGTPQSNGDLPQKIDDIKTVTNQLADTLEWDGVSAYRFTAGALAEGPSGGGGGDSAADIYAYFTDSNREDVFKADVSDLPTNFELATALGTADDAVLAAIAAVQSDTDNIQTRLPAALVSGRMDSSVGAMATNVITAASTASDYITEVQSGLATSTAIANVQSAVDAIDDYLDSEIAAILADTNELQLNQGNWLTATGFAVPGSAMTLTSGERNSVADALLDRANGIETGVTFRQAQRAMAALAMGLVGDAGEDQESYYGIGQPASGTPRVIAEVDIDGNRTSITLNL